jgi:hypothetical protein
MLDIERDSMVDTIATVRLEERVANASPQQRAKTFKLMIVICGARLLKEIVSQCLA